MSCIIPLPCERRLPFQRSLVPPLSPKLHPSLLCLPQKLMLNSCLGDRPWKWQVGTQIRGVLCHEHLCHKRCQCQGSFSWHLAVSIWRPLQKRFYLLRQEGDTQLCKHHKNITKWVLCCQAQLNKAVVATTEPMGRHDGESFASSFAYK